MIKRTGDYHYIYMVIDGPGNNDIGFGHLFHEGALPAELGEFVLLPSLSGSSTDSLIIIDIHSHKAIGPNNGSVVYNGTTYTVSNQVDIDQPIAPVGKSATDFCHLHVYHPENPYEDPQLISNAKDPLTIINHYPLSCWPVYHSLHRLNSPGMNTYYGGDSPSSIAADCYMDNPGILGSAPDQYYAHGLMGLQQLDFFIRKIDDPNELAIYWGNSQSKYKRLVGPYYESRFCLGALNNTSIYPPILSSNQFGSNTHTGINPAAYNYTPHDFYYFSDFYQRIHKNCPLGPGQLMLAKCNEDARYEDGIYHLYFRTTTLNGGIYDNTANLAMDLRIDNFKPYLKKVQVRNADNTLSYYEGEWNWNGTHLLFSNPVSQSIFPSGDLKVVVQSSEPLESLSCDLINYSSGLSNNPVPNTNRTFWEFTVPLSELAVGTWSLSFNGSDLSANSLEHFSSTNLSQGALVPIRYDNNVWQPAPNPGADNTHHITIGSMTPPLADFTPLETTINAGQSVSFEDHSSGGITTRSWYFPGGNPQNADIANPIVTYSTANDYPAFLTVSNPIGSDTKTGIVHITNEPVAPVCNFFPQNIMIEAGSTVDFLDLSTGNPTQWSWDFENVAPMSNLQDPSVTYNDPGYYQVWLTVANAQGTSSCSGEVTVSQYLPPLMADCSVNPFLGMPGMNCTMTASLANGVSPYTFCFDWGDGGSNIINSNSFFEQCTHTYLLAGEFNPKVIIMDATGQMAQCIEYVTIMSVDPCQGFQAFVTANGGNVQNAYPLNIPVNFNHLTNGGTPPYFYVWHFYPDPVSGGNPSLTYSIDPGPHDVVYSTPGNYQMSLMVCDHNGCTKTNVYNITIYEPEHCLVAKIQKTGDESTVISLGENCFWDYSFAVNSMACTDPPGSMNLPCETNAHWQLLTYPQGQPVAEKYCQPYYGIDCNMGYVNERLFDYTFTETGEYLLRLTVWDNDCQVMNGYDCKNETSLLIRVIDCEETVDLCQTYPVFNFGDNTDQYGRYILVSSDCYSYLLPQAGLCLFATDEIHIMDGFMAYEGSSLLATIIPCPLNLCDKSEPDTIKHLAGQDSLMIIISPVPGNGKYLLRQIAGKENMESIGVYNLQGDLVKHWPGLSVRSMEIDLQGCAPGMYFIRVKSGKRMWASKIIQ